MGAGEMAHDPASPQASKVTQLTVSPNLLNCTAGQASISQTHASWEFAGTSHYPPCLLTILTVPIYEYTDVYYKKTWQLRPGCQQPLGEVGSQELVAVLIEEASQRGL